MTLNRTAAPVVRPPKVWKVAYADTDTGHWITDDGREQRLGKFPSLSSILNTARQEEIRMVYLTGPPPGVAENRGTQGSFERWVLDQAVTSEWEDEKSHFGDVVRGTSQTVEDPTIKKRHKETGVRISLYRASRWFGKKPCSPQQMRNTMQELTHVLSEKWQAPVVLQSTPKLTGRWLWECWLSSIGKTARDYAPLDEETQILIRSTAGQGRIEYCRLPELTSIPGLYCMDARFMYAASVQGLPCGSVQRDTLPDFAPYTRGRYRIRYTVPDSWQHLGLFMTKAAQGEWNYPAAPGACAETWANWTEVQLARNQGWCVDICERLLWPQVGQKGAPVDPLRTWGNRLVDAYLSTQENPMLREALRAIVLFTIGGFSQRLLPRLVLGTPGDAQFMAAVEQTHGAIKRTDAGNYVCEVEEPLSPKEQGLMHPEWCADIWARCRTRMLNYEKKRAGAVVADWGALHVPRAHVIAIRTDALFLTHDPHWPDDGQPGSMRVKPPSVTRNVKAPHSFKELDLLRAKEGAANDGD